MRLRKSSGCVLNIEMQEGSGTVAGDSSRYGNNGALTGCKWAEHGLEFNGISDYVDCGNDASLDITDAITISMLVKSVGASISATPGIIAKRNDGFGLIWMNQAQTSTYFRIYQSNGTAINRDFSMSQNVWHNIVLVADNSENKIRIYRDGVEQGTAKNYDGTIKTGNSVLYIGQQSAQSFNGSIDQPRIYNRALNASEIKQYYESTKHKYV